MSRSAVAAFCTLAVYPMTAAASGVLLPELDLQRVADNNRQHWVALCCQSASQQAYAEVYMA